MVEGRRSARCFSIPIAQLADVEAKERGYWRALRVLSERVPAHAARWEDDEQARVARERLQEVVSQGLGSPAEYKAWFDANVDYLRWSPEQQRFVVDEAARAAQRPLREDELSSQDFWYGIALGTGMCWKEKDTDTYRCRQWSDSHGSPAVRLSRGRMDALSADQDGKERGYRDAVQKLIDELEVVKEPGSASAPRGQVANRAQQIMKRLEGLTGESFERPTFWIEWWKKHRDGMRLSKDGKRLVPRDSDG
jgi:hypothetical protein